jgi:hypothetical protein
MTTEELRESFLIEQLMQDEQLITTYSHYDRIINRLTRLSNWQITRNYGRNIFWSAANWASLTLAVLAAL